MAADDSVDAPAAGDNADDAEVEDGVYAGDAPGSWRTLNKPLAAASKKRPDLQLLGHGVDLLTDACIINPSNTTHRLKGAINAVKPIDVVESRKRGIYSKLAVAQGAQFLAFGASAYGGLGADAERLLDVVFRHYGVHCQQSSMLPKAGFMRWARTYISNALMRGNSALVDVAWRICARKGDGARAAAVRAAAARLVESAVGGAGRD